MRGYHFDESKIGKDFPMEKISVTTGQIVFEFEHLLQKLKKRSPEKFEELAWMDYAEPHPMFFIEEGPIENWEKNSNES